MTAPAAIRATFVDITSIKTRKLAKLTFEIPIEAADAALEALGGWPRPDNEVWVGIARLQEPTLRETVDELRAVTKAHGGLQYVDDILEERGHISPPEKARRAFCNLPMPQQAGIRSDDLKFALWMSKLPVGKEAENAADAIRLWCGVESRRKILPGTKAGERWLELLRMYEADCNGYR